MLRINLIPAYIAEEKKKKGHLAGAIALFAAAAAIPCLYTFVQAAPHKADGADPEELTGSLVSQVDSVTQSATKLADLAAQKQAKVTEAETTRSGIKPISDKRDFVNNTLYYNRIRPEIFRNVAKYTYKDVEYNSMSVSGDVLQLSAFVKNFSDIGRFYLTLFANPDIKALSFEGLHGWPNSNSGGGAPSSPLSAMGGSGGMGTMMGGRGGGMPSGYGPPAGMMGSSGGQGMMGRGGMGGMGGGMSAAGGEGGNTPFAGGANANRPGYPLKVTAQLVKAIDTPVPPGGGASAGGGMMGGGGMGSGGMGSGGGQAAMMGGGGMPAGYSSRGGGSSGAPAGAVGAPTS
jgi:hypothetical protein